MKKFFKKIKKFNDYCKKSETYYIYSKISYSQEGEDLILASFFEEEINKGYKGFYVDIGAHHPIKLSNTNYFYEKGWRGINIDATPSSMKEFNLIRYEDINLEIGVGLYEQEEMFYLFEESALNGFESPIIKSYIDLKFKLNEKIPVKIKNLGNILDEYLPQNTIIDFMNIDAEGKDFDVLKSNNWNKYRPEFILIEELDFMDKNLCDIKSTEMYNFLSELNYIPIAKTMRTIIYKSKV